jgi:hypothetical protein
LIDLASVRRFVVWNRPLHRRMGEIRDNIWCEIYSEVEIDDDLGVGLGPSIVVPVPMTVVVTPMVMVGADEAGLSFFVGTAYVEVVCWRSRGVCEEEAVEGFA